MSLYAVGNFACTFLPISHPQNLNGVELWWFCEAYFDVYSSVSPASLPGCHSPAYYGYNQMLAISETSNVSPLITQYISLQDTYSPQKPPKQMYKHDVHNFCSSMSPLNSINASYHNNADMHCAHPLQHNNFSGSQLPPYIWMFLEIFLCHPSWHFPFDWCGCAIINK